MQAVISRKDLLAHVRFAARAARKSRIPILEHIVVEASDQDFRIVTTDLERRITIDHDPIEFTGDGSVIVSCRRLEKVLAALESDQLRLVLEVHERTLPPPPAEEPPPEPGPTDVEAIAAGVEEPGPDVDEEPAAEASPATAVEIAPDVDLAFYDEAGGRVALRSLPIDSFPARMKVEAATVFDVDAAELRKALARTMFALSSEESRFQLEGLCLELGETLNIMATDGHRLAISRTSAFTIHANERAEGASGPTRRLLPRSIVHDLWVLNATEGVVTFSMGDEFGQVRHELSGTTIGFHSVHGDFPRVDWVLAKEPVNVARVDVAKMVATAELARKLDIKGLDVRITETDVQLLGTDSDRTVSFNRSTPLASLVKRSADVRIGINAVYLIDALKACESAIVHVATTDAASHVTLWPDDDAGQCLQIVMPMHL